MSARSAGEARVRVSFNPEGVFIGRKSLKVFHDESGLYAKMKNDRFYCLNEKDNGYKELKVYKVNWE